METKTAKLFTNGRSQAVRLPKSCAFPGSEVLAKKVGDAVILLPATKSWDVFMDGLNGFTDDFMKDGRQQDTKPQKREPL